MNRPWTFRILHGMAAGFCATLLISVLSFIKSWSEIAPQVDPIGALVKISTISLGWPLVPWIGWGEHFFIGTVLWGIGYALLEPILPGPVRLRGILFAIGPLLLMSLVLMPAAGDGWLGLDLGTGAPIAAVIFHLLYGLYLGNIFYLLEYAQYRPVLVRQRV